VNPRWQPKKENRFCCGSIPELWSELEAWAADELRSVNGQVEFILREAVRRRKNPQGIRPTTIPATRGVRPGSAERKA